MRNCEIPLEEDSATPFTDGALHSDGCVQIDLVTYHRSLFRGKAHHNSASLLFDVTAANPAGLAALARAGLFERYESEEVVKAKETEYGGTRHPTYHPIPVVLSAYGV